MDLTVYSRPECHLCEVMLGRLNQLQESYNFRVNVIDVDSNIELKKRYGLTIPVLVIAHDDISQEEVLCQTHIDETLLSEKLTALNNVKGD